MEAHGPWGYSSEQDNQNALKGKNFKDIGLVSTAVENAMIKSDERIGVQAWLNANPKVKGAFDMKVQIQDSKAKKASSTSADGV